MAIRLSFTYGAFMFTRDLMRTIAPVILLMLFAGQRAICQEGPAAGSGGAAGAADARAKDRAAIQAAMKSFVKDFEARDAKALAVHWTAEGEFENDRGNNVHGHAALEQAFAEFFKRTPDVSAAIESTGLRFLSDATAIEDGKVTVRRGPADAANPAKYSVLWVRDNGNWRMARLSESPADDPTINDLAWLIGEWKSSPDGHAEIHTTYSWSPSKKFIHGRFTLKKKELSLSGDQIIGVDPATGLIHSWTFEADGGVGDADWTSDGDHWVLDAEGTLSGGSTLSETNVLRRINNDTFTWQSVARLLDDDELADLPPVKVTRVKGQ